MVTKSAPYSDLGSSSSEALPIFSEDVQAGHVTIDVSQLQEPNPESQPPPPFTPYEAEYFTDKSGNIISHDPHLNEDGEALTRFLLTHAERRPQSLVKINGYHPEQRTRLVTKRENGRVKNLTEQYTEHVVDFSFSISLVDSLKAGGPFHFSLGDSEPAYRGKMYREIDSNIEGFTSTRDAPKDQVKVARNWRYYRTRNGLAPWIGPKGGWLPTPKGDFGAIEGESRIPEDALILKSSRTLREWADDYCSSNKVLKEFVYEKVPYGWSLNELEKAIAELIKSTYYRGELEITFPTLDTHIFVRPDTRLSRTLSNNWLKLLLWITLLYPFIWLFKRFHSRGGGTWQVCGAAYAYKRLIKADPDEPDLQHKYATGEITNAMDGSGYMRTVGLREGQWFRRWESTIRENVMGKVQAEEPIVLPNAERSRFAGELLEGYHD